MTKLHFQKLLGDRRGTAVVVVGNLLACWFILLGLRALGLTTICVHNYEQIKAFGIRDLCCLVVLDTESTRDVADAARADGIEVFVLSTDIYANLESHPLPAPDLDPATAGGHILYTSGTTGIYKKIAVNAEREARALQHYVPGLYDSEVVINALNMGLWTIAAYGMGVAMWWVGAKLVVDNRPDLMAHLLDHGVNNVFMLPSTLRQFLAGNAVAKRDLSGLKVSTGGAFLPLSLAQEAARQIPTPIDIVYASTECRSILRQPVVEAEDNRWLTVVEGREIQIFGEDGLPCTLGEEGELGVKLNDFDSQGYLDDEETTRRFFRDGYFFPGDMAVQREDGRVQILGRTSDVIIIQGQKVAVAPIEHRIQNELGVEEVCVFSGLDAEGREQLAVAIQSPREFERAQMEAISASFPGFEVAKFMVIPEFPRAEVGMRKVRRPELRRMAFGV